MSSAERYLYEIRPIKPIKELVPGQSINKACSLQLTKEEVMLCMKNGSVWRRFTGHDPMKVTGLNLDRLHRAAFMSEEEYSNIKVVNGNLEKTPSEIEEAVDVIDVPEEEVIEPVEEETNVVESFLSTSESEEEYTTPTVNDVETPEESDELLETETDDSVEEDSSDISSKELSDEEIEDSSIDDGKTDEIVSEESEGVVEASETASDEEEASESEAEVVVNEVIETKTTNSTQQKNYSKNKPHVNMNNKKKK